MESRDLVADGRSAAHCDVGRGFATVSGVLNVISGFELDQDLASEVFVSPLA